MEERGAQPPTPAAPPARRPPARLAGGIQAAQRVVQAALATDPGSEPLLALAGELGALEVVFALATVHTLLPGERAAESARRFEVIVAQHGFAGQVAELARRVREQVDRRRHPAAFDLLGTLDAGAEGAPPPAPEARACPCGRPLPPEAWGDLRCTECGFVEELTGAAPEEPAGDGRGKSGQFSPGRHFATWWKRIQAAEPETELGDGTEGNYMGERLLADLRRVMRGNGETPEGLNITKVRSMLSALGRTQYNENAALLLKKLSGRAPPDIDPDIARRVELYFGKVLEAFEQINNGGGGGGGGGGANRKNRAYYPYYIYKLLDLLLPPGDRTQRRILNYIYMQKKQTVVNNDLQWQQICRAIGDPAIRYRATIIKSSY